MLSQFKGSAYVQSGGFYLNPQKGLIWYGVQSAGLVRYDMENGKVKIYGVEDGLSTDLIYSIVEDKNGILWLSTSQGISSFDPSQEQFVNYQPADGLPSSYFSAKMYYDTLAGLIYAGGRGKVVYFSPSVFQKKGEQLNIRLTKLLINNTPVAVPPNRYLALPWKRNDITLSFTGINLTNGSENKYAYRMGNDQAEWINIGSQRQIRFANLNPGHYIFEVKTSHKGGDWSVLTDHLEVNIQKPFVQTIGFYSICFVFAFGVIYGWYRYRFSHLMKLEIMRSRISHDLHDEIGSRLTNIGMMSQIVRQKQPDYHENNLWFRQIQEESEAISQSMREIIWNINPDNDSMEEAMPRMLHFATGLLEAKGITVQ
ncbi:MAG: triple tyrosine motif-containing protein, partial [Chitinophagaceae bacterium]